MKHVNRMVYPADQQAIHHVVENLLNVHEQPYDPRRTVICFTECRKDIQTPLQDYAERLYRVAVAVL